LKISKPFVFRACKPKRWFGKFSRVFGNTTVFRVRYDQEKKEFWPLVEWKYLGDTLLCTACKDYYISKLTEAVNKAKKIMSSIPGGSFIINEFGQVIVPSSCGDGTRMLVGEIDGAIVLENPWDGGYIDLSDDSRLQVGDMWKKPYIGVRYNLSKRSQIYYYDDKKEKVFYPIEQDKELIRKLRKVRRYGSVRFIVNHHGIVLTKIPEGEYLEGEDRWQPIYVGRINYNLWFKKEE
jgi:hypothetical protein